MSYEQRLRESTPWQDIETAPRDGREVILAVKTRAGIQHGLLVAHYMGGGHPPIDAGWYFSNGHMMFDHAFKPTHWMPLPNHSQWVPVPEGWQAQKQHAPVSPLNEACAAIGAEADAEIARLRAAYRELADALGCDAMDSHAGRLSIAREWRAARLRGLLVPDEDFAP